MADHEPDMPSADTNEEDALMQASHSAQKADTHHNDSQFGDFAGTCIHAVNGVELVADADGVAYWPATDTLLVADLHLEKGSSFARRGQLLPPYDTAVTLRRLAACLDRWRPKRVVALGDSFHDKDAALRLPTEAKEVLLSMMHQRDWTWITGNHDPLPPAGLGGTVTDELRDGGLVLRHEPLVDYEPGEIAGHLHPQARIIRRGRSVRRSCFATSRSRMIMPSFGAYTGGLNVLDAAFDGLFDGRKFHALMRGDGVVYRIAGQELG
ncbi:MAG: ligase-associated DNA damage response endonuclease PdeM [Pseudomonadota bacterium]